MLRAAVLGLGVFFLLVLSEPLPAASGDTLSSVATPFDCPQGLTWDGSYLWNVDRKSDQIYQIDPASGAVLDSLPAPAYVPRGLTWDGQRLWCVDAEESQIYAINPKSRIVEKTIYCPASRPAGLAWDGRHLWLADYGADELLQISTEDGTTITSIPSPSGNPQGLTFDGKYLWVADRIADMIYMVTPERGEVVVCFAAPGPYAWGLAWDGEHLWNADYQSDRIYKLVVDDDTPFVRLEEKAQQLEFIHQVRNYGPGTLKTLDIYLSIPQDMNNQELLEPVAFIPAASEIVADKWGQKVARFHFSDLGPTEFATVTMLARAKLYQNRYFVFPDKVGSLAEIPDDIRQRYLVDDSKFDLKNPVIEEAVKAAVGDETNPYWIGRKIFNYVIEHLEYELAGGWNVAPAVLERGNGSCSEYSFVYIAMCRAAGLPARYVGSVAIRGDDASTDDVYHRWVEIYLPNFGWLPVDPSGGDSKRPASQANAFGFLNNRYLITTAGGGGSEYLEWGYNTNALWTSSGRCKVETEAFGEWTPLPPESE
jgi:transglutaminase-like putative cysteine protease